MSQKQDQTKAVVQPKNSEAYSSGNIRVVNESAEIFFYAPVDPSSVLRLNSTVSELTNEIIQEYSTLRNRRTRIEISPITLHINSTGGWVTSGLAAMDTIKGNHISIDTVIEGEACSAATLLSIAGHHRSIKKHSIVLIHQMSAWAEGTYQDIKAEYHNLTRLHKILRRIYLEYTKIPAKYLDSELFKKDVYLTAAEALKYGIVDEIL